MQTLVAPLSVRRNPIQATLERARTVTVTPVNIPPPDDISESLGRLDRRISEITDKITEATSLRRTLLGVEAQERKQVGAQIASLETRKRVLQSKKENHISKNHRAVRERARLEEEAVRERELVAQYCSDYRRLDLKPLQWRNTKGWPLMAIFSLESGTFTLGARAERRRFYGYYGDGWRTSVKQVCEPSLPTSVKECFADVLTNFLKTARQKKKTILLSAEFSGVVPLEAKQKIAEARKRFKGVFILAQVRDWKIEERKATTVQVRPKPAPIVQGDPLVVGWDGKGFWLVTSFDTTSLERYIEQVHCAKREDSSKN